jgi:hypothetical protein
MKVVANQLEPAEYRSSADASIAAAATSSAERYVRSVSWALGVGAKPPSVDPATATRSLWHFATRNWQIAPLLSSRVRQFAAFVGVNGDADQDLDRLHALATSVRALAEVQMLLTDRLCAQLSAADIRYALLKGAAYRVVAYKAPNDRGAIDIDLVVPRATLAATEGALRAQGFLPAALDETMRHFRVSDPAERAAVEAHHYELGQFARRQVIESAPPWVAECIVRSERHALVPWHVLKDGRLACYVVVDVHHALSMDIPADEVLISAQETLHRGRSVRVPSPDWLLFFLIYKLYWEGVNTYGTGAFQYADLARLLTTARCGTAEAMIRLCRRYGLEAAAHYVLRRVPQYFGLELDEELQSFVRRTRVVPYKVDAISRNDLGDLWPRIWGYR